MGRRADASHGVDRQSEVPVFGEGGATAMDPDADPDGEIVGPGPFGDRTLNGRRRFDGVNSALEHREELVGAGVDLAPALS